MSKLQRETAGSGDSRGVGQADAALKHCDDARCPCHKHFVTVAEAAALVRKSVRTIYRWLDEGYLVGRKIKNGWLISTSDLLKLLREKIE